LQVSAAIHHHGRAWNSVSYRFGRLFLLIDALSLVAPIVAVVWQFSLLRGLQLHLSPLEPLALGLAIWGLYAADHALDGLRTKCSPWEPNRRRFHRVHWPVLSVLSLFSSISALAIALFALERGTLAVGLAIGAFVLVYFLSVHSGPFRWRGLWPREAAVGLGFGLGTFIPLVPSGRIPSEALIFATTVFSLLCWLNCCAVETWEWRRYGYPPEKRPHISTQWIAQHLPTLAICVGTGALLVGRCLGSGSEIGLAGFSSGAALSLLAWNQALLPDSILGISADLALCVPLLFLPGNGLT
jgi:hypothetical protein